MKRLLLEACVSLCWIAAVTSCSSKSAQKEPNEFIREMGFLNSRTLVGISTTAKGDSLWFRRDQDSQPQNLIANTSDNLRFVPGSGGDAFYVMALKHVRGLKNFTYYFLQSDESGKVTIREVNPSALSSDTKTYSSILGVLNDKSMLVFDLSERDKGEYAVLDCRTLTKHGATQVGAKEGDKRMLMPRLISKAYGPDSNYCVVIESDARASRDGGLIALLLQLHPAEEIERIDLKNRPFQIFAGPTRDSVVVLAYSQYGTLYGTELVIKARDGRPSLAEQRFVRAGAVSLPVVHPLCFEDVEFTPSKSGGVFGTRGATLVISESGKGGTKSWELPVDHHSDFWGYAVTPTLERAAIWDGGMGFKVYDLKALNAGLVPMASVVITSNGN